MKKLSILLITLSFFLHVANAQKRNNIKVTGIGFDNIVKTSSEFNDDYDNEIQAQLLLGNLFNWGFGYERLLGKRLVLGVNIWNFFSSKSTQLEFNTQTKYNSVSGSFVPKINYEPINVPGYYFYSAVFSQSGFQFGFESKYYFQTHDEEGANGVYIGSSYQLAKIDYNFQEVTYKDTTTSSSKFKTDININPATTYINKLGIKLGVSVSKIVSTDFFLGLNYALPANFDNGFHAPISARGISFTMGWQIGVPFK